MRRRVCGLGVQLKAQTKPTVYSPSTLCSSPSARQVETADVLVLNKTDLVSPAERDRLRALLVKLNPAAKVRSGAVLAFRLDLHPATHDPFGQPPRQPPLHSYCQILATSHGHVPLSEVLNTRRFDLEKVQTAPGWLRELNAFEASLRASGGHEHGEAASSSGHDHGHHHHHHKGEADEYGISSFVYYARRPFHPGRLLHDALSRQWGGVLRSKGFFWLATRNDVMGLWQSAGGAWQGEPRCACGVCVAVCLIGLG